jgi:hypothetical protein
MNTAFNSTGLIIVVPIQTSAGVKKVEVRWPNDEQWTLWRWNRPIRRRDLGRGKSWIEPVIAEQADLDLFTAIRVDQSVVLSKAEAWSVIKRFVDCEAEKPQWDADRNAFRIGLTIPMYKIRTEHFLRMPDSQERSECAKTACPENTSRFGLSEIRVNFETFGEFYDKLKIEATGYKSTVPILHKALAATALLDHSLGGAQQ